MSDKTPKSRDELIDLFTEFYIRKGGLTSLLRLFLEIIDDRDQLLKDVAYLKDELSMALQERLVD